MNRHLLHDRNSLEIHKLVALKLREEPVLLEKVRRNLEEAREKLGNTRAREEWEIVLLAPLEDICDFISQEDEHATRMRQSSPFIGIINQAERRRIYEQVFSRASNTLGQPDN